MWHMSKVISGLKQHQRALSTTKQGRKAHYEGLLDSVIHSWVSLLPLGSRCVWKVYMSCYASVGLILFHDFPPIDVVGVFGKPCYEGVLYGVMNSWLSPNTQCRGDLWPWSVNIDPEVGGHIPASHRSYNN